MEKEGDCFSMPKKFYTALVVLLIILLALSFLPVHGEEKIYDTVVRLHVLAHSDSEEDQALKLKVRDAVLEVTAPVLAACQSREQAVAALEDCMEEIRRAAEDVIAAEGREDLAGSVQISLGEEDYPRRTYEDCTLPAGQYMSLQVSIGDAAGQNWWCVLFPPLCLSAATATSTTSSEDAFVAVGLSKDQYSIITETGKTKYKVRFKILEVWQSWFG
jgi:stage II sporulation protein R